MNVMIVDDELMIRMGLEKILNGMDIGIKVIGSHSNGMDALAHLSKLGARDLDLLITDIKMPMMDGLKLAEHTRGKPFATIVLSGFGEFEYARKAMRHGVRDYLLKPIDKKQLHELLMRLKSEGLSDTHETEGEAPPPDMTAGESGLRTEHHAIEELKALLEERYDRNLDLDETAEAVGMSASYLSRLFKQETGVTITDYLIQIRIEKAKQYLTDHPNLKNYEIAQLVGYGDPVYFNKLFKKCVGVTPRDYKEKFR